MRIFNLFTLLPFRMALFLLVLLFQTTMAQSGLDMPNFKAWPRGSLDKSGAVMAFQYGPYAWNSFTPDSLRVYLARKTADSTKATLGRFDTLIVVSMFADTTFKLAARGTSGTDTASIGCGRVLRTISCTVGAVSGTSDSVGFSLDPWPANWRPAAATPQGGVTVTDNSVVRMTGRFTLNSSASPSAFAFADSGGTAAAWTNSGTKAFSAFSIQFRK